MGTGPGKGVSLQIASGPRTQCYLSWALYGLPAKSGPEIMRRRRGEMRSRRLTNKFRRGKEPEKSCNGFKSDPEVFSVSSSRSEGEEEDEVVEIEGDNEVEEVEGEEEDEDEDEDEDEVQEIGEEEEDEEEEVQEVEEEEEEEEEVQEVEGEEEEPGQDEEEGEEEVEEKEKRREASNHRKRTPNKGKQKPQRKRKGRDDEEDNVKKPKEEKGSYTFPMHRVGRIIKSEAPDMRIAQEAIYLVNKAAEKFVESFCEDAYSYSAQDRKGIVSYKNLSTVVCKQRRFDFLSDFVPEKIKAEDALAGRKIAET